MKRQTTQAKSAKSSKIKLPLRDLPRDQARTKVEADTEAHLIKGGATNDINKGVKVAVDL